jgi:hypothetical protein
VKGTCLIALGYTRSPRTSPGTALLVLGGAHELYVADAERGCQLGQAHHRRVALSLLEAAYVLLTEAGKLCQLLLGLLPEVWSVQFRAIASAGDHLEAASVQARQEPARRRTRRSLNRGHPQAAQAGRRLGSPARVQGGSRKFDRYQRQQRDFPVTGCG